MIDGLEVQALRGETATAIAIAAAASAKEKCRTIEISRNQNLKKR